MSSEYDPSLYVVRHGEADFLADKLNDVGHAQMASLRWSLFSDINSRPVRIFSSPQPRAVESAQVLCNGDYDFNLERDVVSWLDIDAYVSGKSDIPRELVAIRSQDSGSKDLALVLVMHEPDMLELMRRFRRTGPPVGDDAAPEGSCWKLALSPGERHSQIIPIASPPIREG